MLQRWKTKKEKTDDFLRMREQDLKILENQEAKRLDPNARMQPVSTNQPFIPWNQRNDIDLSDVD